MKKKIFLVILVIILTITNFILFRNIYNRKIQDHKLEKYSNIQTF